MIESDAPPPPTDKHLIRLRTSIQTYDWGKPGSTSLVAKFAPNSIGPDFEVDENAHYAETWMGTHPSGPLSLFSSPDTPLLSLISSNPSHYLSTSLLTRTQPTTLALSGPTSHSPHLPFIFKILSVGQALPLQAHPDRQLGERLHKRDGEEFVDANHKPEIAIAIGDDGSVDGGIGEGVAFLGFVGFRPLDEIKRFLEGVEELRRAIGDEGVVKEFVEKPSQEGLKRVYGALLTRGKESFEEMKKDVNALVRRVGGRGDGVVNETEAKLLKKVNGQYEEDVGVLATTFFMNLVKLKKGEAIYCGADEVHAWLEGDIIECMAISDNVINSAFVPPAERDISTFTSMLTYTSRPASHWSLQSKPYYATRSRMFNPPLEEFTVLWTSLGGDEEQGTREVLPKAGGPMIGIVTKGSKIRFTVEGRRAVGDVAEGLGGGEVEVEELGEGGVVYVVPGCEVVVEGEGEVWWAGWLG
ncbi:hypothetical protein JAAARDRAFT_135320 [Jaapia argillacea MUCL 33604]|uniref:Mannose-6-phosphate isomerase n=1 Tax=Jaapia argillacea MUCL 33604 TaxID=933084 RepID=A0A067PW70_9AGAM|nr:hypothetical protein JAAARDRAFT_135320 [Jaapia argillacea MUCL 33604]